MGRIIARGSVASPPAGRFRSLRRSAPFRKVSALLNWRTEFYLRWGLRPGVRTASRVARFGPTTPKRARRLADASVDPTDASTTPSEFRFDVPEHGWYN